MEFYRTVKLHCQMKIFFLQDRIMIKILVNNFASIHHLFQFHSVFSVLIGLIDSNYFSLQKSTAFIPQSNLPSI